MLVRVALVLAAGAVLPVGWACGLALLAAAALRKRWAIALLLPLMAVYTTWRAPNPLVDDIARLAPRRYLTVTGDVLGPPAGGPGAYKAELSISDPAPGRLAVNFPAAAPRPRPGDRWTLTGKLARPLPAQNPGGFDAAAYHARHDVFATLRAAEGRRQGPAPGLPAAARRALDGLRMRLVAGLGAGLTPGRAALAGSLALGTGAAPVPRAVADTFRDAGLAHLLAASGAQVALLGGLAYGGLRLAGLAPPWAAGASLPVLVLYLALTGAPPGMVRATVMGAIALMGLALGRKAIPFAALWATVAGMLVVEPGCARDLGFQFSVLATYALLRLASWQPALPGPAALWSGLLAPLAAWAWVAPWQVATFAVLPLAALPANWVVAPLILALTPWVLGVALVGCATPPLAALLNRVTDLALAGIEAIAASAAGVPGQLLQVPPPGWLVLLLAYGALASGFSRRGLGLATLAAAAWAAPIPHEAFMPAPGRPGLGTLELTMLAVGQGDALVLRTPNNHWVLIDAGPAGAWGDAGEAIVLPYLRRAGCRRLDLVVATHPHADHIGGLPAIARALPINAAWEAGLDEDHAQDLLATWLAAGVPWRTTAEPLATTIDGVSFTALRRPGAPASVNDASVVVRVAYGHASALLAGDLEAEGEAALLPALAPADVLKVGHHGSRGASTTEWLAKLRPRLALISAGAGNVHGHPHAEALDRLREAGTQDVRTDQDGAAILRTEGEDWRYTTAVSGWRTWRMLAGDQAARSARGPAASASSEANSLQI